MHGAISRTVKMGGGGHNGAHVQSKSEALEARTLLTNSVTISPVFDAYESGIAGAFAVYRTGDVSSSLTVNFSLSGTATQAASATGTGDYGFVGTSVVISATSNYQYISIYPNDDSAYEGDETVIATLSSGAYSIGSQQSATLLILDDERQRS